MIKVLIVEDDPMVAMLNTHYLEQVGGFELVQAVNSVKSAIEVLEESRIDLVLLDIFMPEETGFEPFNVYSESRKRNRYYDDFSCT